MTCKKIINIFTIGKFSLIHQIGYDIRSFVLHIHKLKVIQKHDFDKKHFYGHIQIFKRLPRNWDNSNCSNF